jgi:hypothetical protein
MTMRILFSILLAVAPTLFFAQRTLTVIVSDTITVPIESINYQVSVSTEMFEATLYENMETVDVDQVNRQRAMLSKEKMKDLERLLTSMKLNYMNYRSDSYSTSPSYKDYGVGYLVKLKSKKEFLDFFNKINELNYVTGNLIDVQADGTGSFDAKLMNKLYEKALQQANKLAKLAGGTVGELVSIEDAISNNTLANVYATGASATLATDYTNLSAYYTKAMKFTFSLK